MRHLSTRVLSQPPHMPHTVHRAVLRGGCRLLILLLVLGSLLTMHLAPPVQAAARAQLPRKPTPAQIQAIRQQLKKQIHVTHTGTRLKPAGGQTSSPTPLRPLDASLPAYNNIGISDPATRLNASFDGSHRSYSAQALQDVGLVPGIGVTSQNVTFVWPSVAVGQADNYQAAGQVIPVSALPGAATVGFVGASAGGASSGTATLTYTDGSTSTFTLGLTDWWTGTPSFGNQQVVQMSTINTRHGTKSGTFYLYSTTTPLNANKTLQSVTLPTSVSGGQLHVFAVGVGGPAFNNTGISDDSNPGSGAYDGAGGNSYSAQALASADLVPGQQFDTDGMAYTWPTAASGTPDNFQASGQVLPVLPVPNATTLGLLGSATGSNGSGTAMLTYTDGTTSTFTLNFTNWWNGPAQGGNLVAAQFSTINTPTGARPGTYFLYVAETPVSPGKTLQSVTLPTSSTGGQLHVFAVGTRSDRNDLGTSNDSQPGEGAYDGAEHSWSIQALASAGLQQGQPFSFNGVLFTWPASYGSLADNYQAAGQTLAVTPVANATTLAFLGSGTNGSPTGTATIHYTDGSSSTFTLGLNDWWNNAALYGNLIVASFPTLNNPGGTTTHTVYLYDAETSVQAGKTVQSVTLPATVSTGQMHIFAVGTRSAYNNTGISDDSAPALANFDGAGGSYSAQDFADPTIAGWNPGDTLTYQGINYVWPGVPAGQADNYMAAGQVMPVTPVAGATTIGFVGAADFAFPSASGTATLHYTDGSTSTFTLGMTDWSLDSGNATSIMAGNRLFAILPHINTPQGQLVRNLFLFEMEAPLTAGKTLQSVALPSSVNQGRLHVFMIGTRAGESYPNIVGTSDDSDTIFANLDTHGGSYSIQALEAAGLNAGQPFSFNGATFTWPASYSVIPDAYQAAGQVLPVTPVAGATTLAFLGSSSNTTGGSNGGSNTGTATITYTDGSTPTVTLTFTDWWSTSAQGGNQVAATCSYLNTPTGQLTQTVHVYYVEVVLQAGKTLQSVTLPTTVSSGQMHIFAISTR